MSVSLYRPALVYFAAIRAELRGDIGHAPELGVDLVRDGDFARERLEQFAQALPSSSRSAPGRAAPG